MQSEPKKPEISKPKVKTKIKTKEEFHLLLTAYLGLFYMVLILFFIEKL